MAQSIRHLVVLMLENRSFDHMLGFMRTRDYPIEGATDQTNPEKLCENGDIKVEARPVIKLPRDPGHHFEDVNLQLFSHPEGPPVPSGCKPNNGFVASYIAHHAKRSEAKVIMHGFRPDSTSVAALTGLASTYAICDHWFSSVPGPTWPNRFFVHAASSKGTITNDFSTHYDMPSIFESLSAAEEPKTWKVYSHDFPLTTLLQKIAGPEFAANWDSIGTFRRDAASGTLPNYTFIEPKYTRLFGPASDQHPPVDVNPGDQLIEDVYYALRTSPAWEHTLMLVVHDEHGGLFDHVTPPANAAAPDDGHTHPHFDFRRLGVRVPAVLISPFIPPRTIVSKQLEHASVPATLRSLFDLSTPLNERDRAATPFHDVASLQSARPGLPLRFRPMTNQVPLNEWGDDESVSYGTFAELRAKGEASEVPVTDFQEALVEAAHRLSALMGEQRLGTIARVRPLRTEHEAAVYVREVSERFHQRQRALARAQGR